MPSFPPEDPLDQIQSLAPEFVEITRDLVFGQVWQETTLSPRERSLITLAALTVLNRVEQQPVHLQRALDNGLSIDEIAAAITHLAFYGGWPCSVSAFTRLAEFKQAKESACP
ncbi:carboxymuconolactone decarboxylase family protein [Marinobacterium mangrovicola]|uniref:4-carboxymuconolactone decarboxylase n=1 Tax=Marinobacterium mangrovicola TaxID=1476959 RepID=A0A4R1GIM0_9GAMM|nr:carboxymuconolactone decarboxylase family protein [Marinobacterium mangrovicola]TCK04122.1 4-carboxymuconolactone decarboxylase [Marinobacterium mangrovicola]